MITIIKAFVIVFLLVVGIATCGLLAPNAERRNATIVPDRPVDKVSASIESWARDAGVVARANVALAASRCATFAAINGAA